MNDFFSAVVPMRGIFVTGTDTDAGKTCISAALLHWCALQGWRSAGYKPVAAGMEQAADGTWFNSDVLRLRAASSVPLTDAEVCPVQLRAACAPHIAAAQEGRTLELAPLLAHAHTLAARCDVLVVEGAGGFCVPLNEREDLSQLAQALALPVLLVVNMKLGCINHALLTAEAITARGLRLAGWVGNSAAGDMAHWDANVAMLRLQLQQRYGAPCWGLMPHVQQPTPEALAAYWDTAVLRQALAQ